MRLQGTTEGRSNAPRLASSSAASFPRINECPGTHCSLIVQEEREDSSCQRVCGKRKGEEEDRARVKEEEKRSGVLAGAAETSEKLAKKRRLQRKNFQLGLPKRNGWPQYHKVSNWQERQSRICQKEQSHQSKSPGREMGESQGEREPHLCEKDEGQTGSMERKESAPQ